jgi:hypothetical protein
MMMLKAMAIQVINVTSGTDGKCLLKKNVIAPISSDSIAGNVHQGEEENSF